jgi:uncharacterized protein (TIGR01777 family)
MVMKIVIAGGTGFLGRPLAGALAAERHDVVVLSRAPSHARDGVRFVSWTPDGGAGAFAGEIDGAGAIVNLAGEPIAAKRWSADQKRQILDSRVNATRSLVEAVRRAASPPGVLVSGSAVGYYGPLDDQFATEDTQAGSDFLARVSVQWEAEAHRAASDRTRVVCLRTGLVLERDGGALPKMLAPFRLFAGGPVGSGRQYWPWIHRDDWIRLVRWVIEAGAASGPVNGTAPNPVTNREFAAALGRVLHRPAVLPAPGFALKLMLGEMAGALLLSGQRAIPAKAQRLGFTFRHTTVYDALRALFRDSTPA